MEGYGSDVDFTAYAQAQGWTVPGGAVAPARLRGSLFVDAAYGPQFPGAPASGDQLLGWPRRDASDRYGNPIPSGSVPKRVEYAAYEAAYAELQAPGSLAPITASGDRVKREKVDVLEIEYAVDGANPSAPNLRPVLAAVDGLLQPLLAPSLPAILVV